MSKALYVCVRDSANIEPVRQHVESLMRLLEPDNISANAPFVCCHDGVIIGLSNPTTSSDVKDGSVCLGAHIATSDWDQPNADAPEGCYALFRSNEHTVEVLSDVVASRTVWYIKTERLFVASTSQRAIVGLIGGFELNPDVIPWMLSTGTLGPSQGWDKRVSRLEGDSRVLLDRSRWHLNKSSNPVVFDPETASDHEHFERLETTLLSGIEALKLDCNKWVLPLSGGYDSRSILCLLRNAVKPKAITWGVHSALEDSQSDAAIAKALAAYFKLDHQYFETDAGHVPLETTVDRFVKAGEGRVDHVAAYIDGFNLWKTLFERGVNGIIRGDEGFGWKPVSSHLDVRVKLGMPLWSDFSNLQKLSSFGFDKTFDDQTVPPHLNKHNEESYACWRDRLYHQFRLPVIVAALNDIKSPYVEIQNPLLLKRIIYLVRTLPDHLRTDKALYKKIVLAITPKIKFAKRSSISTQQTVVSSAGAVKYLRHELSQKYVEEVIPKPFIDYILNNMGSSDGRTNNKVLRKLRRLASQHLPPWLVERFPLLIAKPIMNFNVLAFRVLMICRVNRMLQEEGCSESAANVAQVCGKD